MTISTIKVDTKLAATHKDASMVLSVRDLSVVSSPEGKNKIVRTFENSPFDFRFVFAPNQNPIQQAKYLKKVGEEQKAEAPNSITVVYTNNYTSPLNYMPFTSWILAHRIGHINLQHDGALHSNKRVFTAVQEFAYELMPRQVENTGLMEPVTDSCTDGHDGLRFLMMFFLNTRAARQGNILLPADCFGEMVAQYIITGKISLIKAEDLIARIEMLGSAEGKHNFMVYMHLRAIAGVLYGRTEKLKFETIQKYINTLEKKLAAGVHEYLQGMVGKTVSF